MGKSQKRFLIVGPNFDTYLGSFREAAIAVLQNFYSLHGALVGVQRLFLYVSRRRGPAFPFPGWGSVTISNRIKI
jgi:hypothetical protein